MDLPATMVNGKLNLFTSEGILNITKKMKFSDTSEMRTLQPDLI